MPVLAFLTELFGSPYLAKIVLLAGLIYVVQWLPPTWFKRAG